MSTAANALFRPVDSVAADSAVVAADSAVVAGDFIPFYWNGDYHLFYLRDWRDPAGHGEGTPWWHIVTRDFVSFEDWGEALPRGSRDEQDLYVFTGCAYEWEGQFHIFYTGHNPHFRSAGRPAQAVLHATSPDLRTWTKDPDFRFFAPAELGYEPHDWRDPFIYWDPRYGEHAMLLAARKNTGPSRNRGLTALATSPDLRHWTVREPLWAPDLYFTHECPDLFSMGDWWYLVYSTFTERCVTHYRMARDLDGPWLAPANDTFDGRAYYAAKTAGPDGPGAPRYIFGWLPTRSEEKDEGHWQWGGDLVVHELVQETDGALTVRPPDTVLAPFTRSVPLEPQPVLGEWTVTLNTISADAVGRQSFMSLGELPETGVVQTQVRVEPGTVAAGLLLRVSPDYDGYYQLRLEPAQQRLVIDRWPRPGDQPFMLERPLKIAPGDPVTLTVLVDGTNLVAYAGSGGLSDAHVALSCRMYDHRQGALGIFVTEGRATFDGTRMMARPEDVDSRQETLG
jgi:beta-fructofuranosidase